LIDETSKSKLNGIFSHYQGKKDDLIPILQDAQEEFGYLSQDVMREIGKFLKIPESNVYGVATFYALFKLKPSGKHIIRVCRGTACHVRGGARILREIEHRLGIKPGETTKDMEYTLETVSCIGACALAPNITVGKELYGQLTTKKIAEVIGDRSKSEKSEK
jgi:NADH:ubiquinone oxidoreductase subunit E